MEPPLGAGAALAGAPPRLSLARAGEGGAGRNPAGPGGGGSERPVPVRAAGDLVLFLVGMFIDT